MTPFAFTGSLPTRRLVVVLVGTLSMALTISGCVGGPSEPGQARTPGPAQRSAAQVPPSGQAKLAKFYKQDLVWSECGADKCARLNVPVDYARPEGGTLKLSVLKVPAKSPQQRIGSLVVNPGGPGASATVGYARYADLVVTEAIRATYDVVGVDPRGVQDSSPIKCLNDRELDAFLGIDQTPDTPTEQQQLADSAKAFGRKCESKAGALLGHVSTIEAAKDMDILRAALGETKLDYLGKSYGTFLGATYADLFPSKVGKFVLDGVIAPELAQSQVQEGQAVGFETATRAYVQDCVNRGDCPLGGTLDSGMARLRAFLKQLDVQPMPLDDPYVKKLTEGWALLGIGFPMYDPKYWPLLTDALRNAFAGKAGPLMKLAGYYAERSDKGAYTGNLMQGMYAVNCLDRSDSKVVAHYAAEARSLSVQAPLWGPVIAWGALPCGYWPVPAKSRPKRITAAGSGPILVVGTTRDPATPYKWAQDLAAELKDGHLITYDGDGHTAYMRSNKCVDGAVDAYLLKGVVPPPGLKC